MKTDVSKKINFQESVVLSKWVVYLFGNVAGLVFKGRELSLHWWPKGTTSTSILISAIRLPLHPCKLSWIKTILQELVSCLFIRYSLEENIIYSILLLW